MSPRSALPAPSVPPVVRSGLSWSDAETAGGDELRALTGEELALLLSECLRDYDDLRRRAEAMTRKTAERRRAFEHMASVHRVAQRLHYYVGVSLGLEG